MSDAWNGSLRPIRIRWWFSTTKWTTKIWSDFDFRHISDWFSLVVLVLGYISQKVIDTLSVATCRNIGRTKYITCNFGGTGFKFKCIHHIFHWLIWISNIAPFIFMIIIRPCLTLTIASSEALIVIWIRCHIIAINKMNNIMLKDIPWVNDAKSVSMTSASPELVVMVIVDACWNISVHCAFTMKLHVQWLDSSC